MNQAIIHYTQAMNRPAALVERQRPRCGACRLPIQLSSLHRKPSPAPSLPMQLQLIRDSHLPDPVSILPSPQPASFQAVAPASRLRCRLSNGGSCGDGGGDSGCRRGCLQDERRSLVARGLTVSCEVEGGSPALRSSRSTRGTQQ